MFYIHCFKIEERTSRLYYINQQNCSKWNWKKLMEYYGATKEIGLLSRLKGKYHTIQMVPTHNYPLNHHSTKCGWTRILKLAHNLLFNRIGLTRQNAHNHRGSQRREVCGHIAFIKIKIASKKELHLLLDGEMNQVPLKSGTAHLGSRTHRLFKVLAGQGTPQRNQHETKLILQGGIGSKDEPGQV